MITYRSAEGSRVVRASQIGLMRTPTTCGADRRSRSEPTVSDMHMHAEHRPNSRCAATQPTTHQTTRPGRHGGPQEAQWQAAALESASWPERVASALRGEENVAGGRARLKAATSRLYEWSR